MESLERVQGVENVTHKEKLPRIQRKKETIHKRSGIRTTQDISGEVMNEHGSKENVKVLRLRT